MVDLPVSLTAERLAEMGINAAKDSERTRLSFTDIDLYPEWLNGLESEMEDKAFFRDGTLSGRESMPLAR